MTKTQTTILVPKKLDARTTKGPVLLRKLQATMVGAFAALSLFACGGTTINGGQDSGRDGSSSLMDGGVTMDTPNMGEFCPTARCGAGTMCCEASRMCIVAGAVCIAEGADVPTPPNLCGGATCGPMQQCCMTRVGPTCLPQGVMCNPVMGTDGGGPVNDAGGMGGICGGALCTATQECCNSGGIQVCVPRGSCPGGGGVMCGRQTCQGAQVCCSLTGPGGMMGMLCLSAMQCQQAGGGTDGGVADSGVASFCAMARCGAGTFCCESQRACIPGNLTCRSAPPSMCRPQCAPGQVCCGNMCVGAGMCAIDPCTGVTCGEGFSCCGVGRNSGTCTAAACLACCM